MCTHICLKCFWFFCSVCGYTCIVCGNSMAQSSSFDGSKSTKGASKLRRDLINAEIANLRDLLPLPSSTRQRLSQLQLMALVCVYVRKANYFQQVFRKYDSGDISGPNFGFSKAMSGFLMMMTQNGKLLYISDNAAEYLGHSMEDLLIHGDSVYDIIDKQDHQAVQSELMRSGGTPLDERIFLCRMNVSRNARRQMRFGDQKVVLVQGHFLSFLPLCSRNEPVFLATCTPVAMPETRECVVQGSTNIFTSIHSMDMKFVHLDKNGEFHLGYTKDNIQGTSWYQLIHWDNIKEAQTKHRMITQADQDRACILLLRLQSHTGFWLWIHVVLQVKDNMEGSQHPVIVCTNQVLSEKEAGVMRANSWLYHYYTVQSKLQYSLALESHTARMPTFYPAVMPYPHHPHPHPHIPPEPPLHPQLLHHPHPHHPHPHHHPHHHHQHPGPSSLNGSQQNSPTTPQYSFNSASSYQSSSSPSSSPGYPRLTALSTWVPVPSPRYQGVYSDAPERLAVEDPGGFASPRSEDVTCGMVQLVSTDIRPLSGRGLSAKYEHKTRQLGTRTTHEFEGSDEDLEAMTSCKDDLVSVVPSPSHSDPQTVPDVGHPLAVELRHSMGHLAPIRCLEGTESAMEQFVPECTRIRKNSEELEYFSWMQGSHRGYTYQQRPYGCETDMSPSSTGSSSDFAVPHTPEGWQGTAGTDAQCKENFGKEAKKASRVKRRKVAKANPVSKARDKGCSVTSGLSAPYPVRISGSPFNGYLNDMCSCNANTCSPLCLCLKHYDSGLKWKSGAILEDSWRFCCSVLNKSNPVSSPNMAVPFSSALEGIAQQPLPKPLPLKVRSTNSEDWPNDDSVPAGTIATPQHADAAVPHQGALVTNPAVTSNNNNDSYRSHCNNQNGALEWTEIHHGGQQCQSRSFTSEQQEGSSCCSVENKCQNG